MSDFAKNLRRFRKGKRYTQAQLGEMLHFGYTAIANYESGRNEPSFDALLKLAEMLEVTPNDLLGYAPQDAERRLLHRFGMLDETQKGLIWQMLEQMTGESGSVGKGND